MSFFFFRSVRRKINIEEEVRFLPLRSGAAVVVTQRNGMITVTASAESGGDDVAAWPDEALRQGQPCLPAQKQETWLR